MYDVTIKHIEAKQAVGVAHSGSYMEINKAFTELFTKLGAAGRAGDVRQMFGLYYDDPETVPVEKLRSVACAVLASGQALPDGLNAYRVEAGDYAVLTHKGPYATLHHAYKWLYGTWLQNSGRAVRDEPIFEIYVNNPREVPASELITEICLPLEQTG